LRLLVGDDWAEDHHDVELMDVSGRVLARARLPEGVAGMARLHAMIAGQLGDADPDEVQVLVGIETDRGPWVAALAAAGYEVFAVNPLQAAQYRKRHAVPGAKSDAGDAHVLADMVRTDAHQLRPVAGDSAQAQAVKVVARTHKTLIWERTRTTQRLRHALREYFPAALVAFEDLDAADTLELLAKAPDPAAAARLTMGQISAALRRARRRNISGKAAAIQAALRAEHLGQPPAVTAAYAASVRALAAVLVTLGEQVKALQGQVEAHFGQHPAAEIIASQPGLGPILGARVLAELERLRAPADDLLHLLPHRLQADPQRLQRPGGHALALVDQAQQDVLGAQVVVVEHPGLFLRQDHNPPGPVGKPLKHLNQHSSAAVMHRTSQPRDQFPLPRPNPSPCGRGHDPEHARNDLRRERRRHRRPARSTAELASPQRRPPEP
jgi:transposase